MENAPKKILEFKEYAFKSRKISLETLDKMIEVVITPKTGMIDTIISALKLIVFFAYIHARKQIIKEKVEIDLQRYQQNRTDSNQGDIDNDDQD